MQDQFSRSELLIGRAAINKLKGSTVAVFGLGGVGSWAAEALARAGVGRLVLVDDDCVCLTNINRQLIATRSTVGRLKTEVMAERVLDINPDILAEQQVCFVGPDTIDRFDFSSYDYCIDAVDTVTAKLLIIERAAAAGKPVISCMGAGNKFDPTAFEVTDIYKTSVCPLAKVMRRELKKRGIEKLTVVYSKEPASPPDKGEGLGCREGGCICPPEARRNCTVRRQLPGSLPFVPPVAGLIAAGKVVQDLIAEEDRHA